MPERTQTMNQKLTELLTEMEASYPSYNPESVVKLPNKEAVPTVSSHQLQGGKLTVTYQTQGSEVAQAHLIYTTQKENIGYQEWFRKPMALVGEDQAEVTLPKGTKHYFVNLIDEHQFLVCYPKIGDKNTPKKKSPFVSQALAAPLN